MTRLASALDLLRRHHSANRPIVDRGTPHSASWHSLWPTLAEIRRDAAAGDVECRDWLDLNRSLITAVEERQRHRTADAVTFRGSARR